MFEYTRKQPNKTLKSLGSARPKIFRDSVNGDFIQSTDYHVLESNPNDFNLDNLISASVPITSAPVSEDVSLDGIDKVENASLTILEHENFIIDNYNKKEK